MSDRKDEKIRCDACPVMCYIADGKSGACDRYANHDGQIVRLDPLTILDRRMAAGDSVKPFLGANWDGGLGQEDEVFVTAIGAGTTYPDYKPAPFIVASKAADADMITVVTEGIFSYCGAKVKIGRDGQMPFGAFRYKSPCPPGGTHTYVWTATARAGNKVLARATATRKYPE